jgi:pimeloyl-ACP methyl ester carboxylesterase
LLVDPISDGKQIPATESHSFLNGLESDYPTMIQYWTSIVGPNSAVRERLLGDLGAVTKDTLLQSLRSVMQFDPDPLLARYQGPIMAVVTPQNDAGFSLHRLGRGFPHRVVTGTGHWIQLDQPEEFNRLLDEFLSTKSVSGKDKRER